MYLPPSEYLGNTEILNSPSLESFPYRCCFFLKLFTLSISVKRRIKCLPQYLREINTHKRLLPSAMFLKAWPAGKGGMGCGAFPEELLRKKNFFVPARNQRLNIVVKNPNDLGSRNKTSWCLTNCNCSASWSLFIGETLCSLCHDAPQPPVSGVEWCSGSIKLKCIQDVFQEENHCHCK